MRPFLVNPLFILAFFFCAAAAARADATVHKEAPPTWAEFIPLPELDPKRDNQHQDGLAHLLRDDQIVQQEGGHDDFRRSAYKIIARPGLDEGANITIDFDPSKHRVSLNRIHVVRDGQVEDRLSETKIHVYRQETDAERGILNGWLTARVHLTDIRVGDVVDYALTREVRPTVGEDLYYGRFATQWFVPISLNRTKITWRANSRLYTRQMRTDLSPSITTKDDWTTYFWESHDPEPVKVEPNRPAGYPAVPSIEVSSTSHWRDIIAAVLPYYEAAADLPLPFMEKVQAIAAASDDPKARMVAAMRLVQDDIRYVSLSIGSGSYVPRRPEEVVRSGFGDCKDKSLLLISVLRLLGIEAETALTHISEGAALDRELPTLSSFDHAIVKAVIDDVPYWIDATNYLQGGTADTFVQPDYGYALVVRAESDALEKLPTDPAEMPTITTDESFWFPWQEGETLTLLVKTVYEGADADQQRSQIARLSLSRIADDYLNYYAEWYPGIRSTDDLVVRDDRDRNTIEIEESYDLSWEALTQGELAENFPLRADVRPDLPTLNAAQRTMPVAIGQPRYRRHVVRVSNLKGEYRGPEADILKPYFLMKVYSQYVAGVFEIDWHFRTLMREVPVAALQHYRRAVDNVNENVLWYYDFTYYDE